MNSQSSEAEILRVFENTLQHEGPQAGVQFLNARTAHRYTCIFKLDGGFLKSLYVFDKLGQSTPDSLIKVKLENSFCQFVFRDGVFATFSSSNDERVEDMKAAQKFDSYVGVPLLDNYGELFGTLCHIDEHALDMPAEEFTILEKAARILPKYLLRALNAETAKPLGG